MLVEQRSRRSLIAATLGGLAGLAAGALGRPAAIRAANGDPLTLGQSNSATAETSLTENGGGYDGAGLKVVANARSAAIQAQCDNEYGAAIRATSTNGFGITADGTKIGVIGQASSGGVGVSGFNPYDGIGVQGVAADRVGVQGHAGSLSAPTAPIGVGVFGTARTVKDSISVPSTAVYGHSGDGPTPAPPIRTGVYGTSTSGNGVHGSSESGSGVRAVSTSGAGLHASSSSGRGVVATSGSSSQPGIVGQSTSSKSGIVGFSGSGTPPTGPVETGVFGTSAAAAGTGVWGAGQPSGLGSAGVYGEGDIGAWGYGGWGVFGAGDTGVYGFSGSSVPAAPLGTGVFGYSTSGTGVHARAGSSGIALKVTGKVQFNRSGKIAASAGVSSVRKSLAGVTTASLIIAVLQSSEPGVWIRAAVPSSGSFTVYFSKALPSSATVGYLVIN